VKNPYEGLGWSRWASLAEMGRQRLNNCRHGDLSTWLQAVDALPQGPRRHCELDRDAPELGPAATDRRTLRANLMALHPWRKGPLVLAGVRVDSEWRSDWKWQRLAPHLDLAGHAVLDIGCGNGYFGLRMLGAGAKKVLGVDPTLVFVMQWLAMQKLCPGLDHWVLPLGIEDVPDPINGFDSVFSMGVLYHRRDAVRHLRRIKQLVRNGGQAVLETLILPGAGEDVLIPAGRYARMRNVHAVPSLKVLQGWIARAGLPAARVLDISRTTPGEQRSTGWMKFESLRESLDTGNPGLTVEGHPAPVRAALLMRL